MFAQPSDTLAAEIYALIPARGSVFSRSVLTRLREERGETDTNGLFGRIAFGRHASAVSGPAFERALAHLRLEHAIRYGLGYYDPFRPIEKNPLFVSERRPPGMIGPWVYRTVRRAPGAPAAYERPIIGAPTSGALVAMLTRFHEP